MPARKATRPELEANAPTRPRFVGAERKREAKAVELDPRLVLFADRLADLLVADLLRNPVR